MKLAVLSSPNNVHLFPRFKDLFDRIFVESQFFTLNQNWFLMNQDALNSVLVHADLCLFILDEQDLEAPWLVYSLGTLGEKKSRGLFFFPYSDFILPDWIGPFSVFFDLQNVRKSILTYHGEWEKRVLRVVAQTELDFQNIELVNYNVIKAVLDGDRFLLGLLLDAGFSQSLEDEKGVPLISLAAREGHLHILNVLVAAGADINAVAQDRGNTPIMDAAAVGHVEVVTFLITQGASLEHRSKNGQTALLLAAGNQRIESAMELIKAGADIESVDALGMSSRKYASLFHETALLEFMDKYSKS